MYPVLVPVRITLTAEHLPEPFVYWRYDLRLLDSMQKHANRPGTLTITVEEYDPSDCESPAITVWEWRREGFCTGQ